jgi:hypothetical protein
VAIISYDVWQRRFASDRGALGKSLNFDPQNVRPLTRAISRERELATRAAVHTSRYGLMLQCTRESALLGICGGFLGMLGAALSVGRCGSLAREFAAGRRDPYRLARALFGNGHLAFLRPPLRALMTGLRVPMHRLE